MGFTVGTDDVLNVIVKKNRHLKWYATRQIMLRLRERQQK